MEWLTRFLPSRCRSLTVSDRESTSDELSNFESRLSKLEKQQESLTFVVEGVLSEPRCCNRRCACAVSPPGRSKIIEWWSIGFGVIGCASTIVLGFFGIVASAAFTMYSIQDSQIREQKSVIRELESELDGQQDEFHENRRKVAIKLGKLERESESGIYFKPGPDADFETEDIPATKRTTAPSEPE